MRAADGSLQMAASLEGPSGVVTLEREIETLALDERDGDWLLAGGLLPAGVAEVEVLDASGEMVAAALAAGAWIAAVRGEWSDPVAVFRDGEGRIVPRVLPAGMEPVEDAITPCPGCGALTWACAWGDAVCVTCGNRETVGAFYGGPAERVDFPADEVCDDAPDPVVAEFLRDERRSQVAGAYGLDSGWPGTRRLAGGDDACVRLDHGDGAEWVAVTTDRPGRARDPLSAALAEAFEDPESVWPRLSEPALALWLAARRRAIAARVAGAERRVGFIHVDGCAHVATVAADGAAWAAALEVEEAVVTVAARGVPPATVRLARVVDPDPYVDDLRW